MKHKFSKETLYHFNCGKCNKWWTIADHHFINIMPRNGTLSLETITCPHCKEEKKFKEIDNIGEK